MNIISYQENGICKLIIPSKENENKLNELALSQVPQGIVYSIIDSNNLPNNRAFRNAWELNMGTVAINRPKAELLHMNRLRLLRSEQLGKLDMEYLKALETKDATKEQTVIDQKNLLRNMPTSFDMSTIPLSDLHLAKPVYLEGDIGALQNMIPK